MPHTYGSCAICGAAIHPPRDGRMQLAIYRGQVAHARCGKATLEAAHKKGDVQGPPPCARCGLHGHSDEDHNRPPTTNVS